MFSKRMAGPFLYSVNLKLQNSDKTSSLALIFNEEKNKYKKSNIFKHFTIITKTL